jgi:hypothetical protein
MVYILLISFGMASENEALGGKQSIFFFGEGTQ